MAKDVKIDLRKNVIEMFEDEYLKWLKMKLDRLLDSKEIDELLEDNKSDYGFVREIIYALMEWKLETIKNWCPYPRKMSNNVKKMQRGGMYGTATIKLFRVEDPKVSFVEIKYMCCGLSAVRVSEILDLPLVEKYIDVNPFCYLTEDDFNRLSAIAPALFFKIEIEQTVSL